MTDSSQLLDDRLLFFLRHRDDIKTWAAIERDVTEVVHQLLTSAQPMIDERLVKEEPGVSVERYDWKSYQRIRARRPAWPEGIGVTLEWEPKVDPGGGALPKVGVFWVETPEVAEERARLIQRCRDGGLEALKYKVPADKSWPAMRRVDRSREWWHDPDAWLAGVVDTVIDLWPRVAPLIDGVVSSSNPEISGG